MTYLSSLLDLARSVTTEAQEDFETWCEANAPWLSTAYGELGVKEVAGAGRRKSNPQINAYLQSCWNTAKTGTYDLKDDSTAWCSAFVNWCLLKQGIKGTGSTWSHSWLTWKGGLHLGKTLESAPVGSIVVMSRGDAAKQQGHVAFLWSRSGGKPQYLGGNQGDGTLSNRASDRVSIAHYPNKILGVIWPLRAIATPSPWADGRVA